MIPLPGYDTTLTVGVYDYYHRLLLLVTARVRYHSYTITTDCYCWSLAGYDTTVTVGVYDHHHKLLLLVIARVRYHFYSGSL